VNPIYKNALNGTLVSGLSGTNFASYTCANVTPLEIRIVWIDTEGLHKPLHKIAPGGSHTFENFWTDCYFIVENAKTGGFMGVFQPVAGTPSQTIDYTMLVDPNDIGAPPKPFTARLIPPDSPLVTVGFGVAPSGNAISREQYWSRQPDSFSLAADEVRTVSITTTRGLEETSSKTNTVAESIGVNTSAGWGPVSAGVSSTLSNTSTTFQQLTVSEETAVYEAKTFDNTGYPSSMYLIWQLVDVLTVYDKKKLHAPMSTFNIGQPPSIITGPWNPTTVVKPPVVVSKPPAPTTPRPGAK
jgi:hypothetical protein